LCFFQDQEAQIEAVRSELTKAEDRFREANEKELPEELFRVQAEEKRNELNDLVAKFTKLNSTNNSPMGWKASPDKSSPREANRRSHSPASGYPSMVAGTGRRR
jgi:predicted phage gp36 major capsid-like protein